MGLWVYANGDLYVTWKPLITNGHNDGVIMWKRLWGKAINANNKNDSFAKGGLSAFSVEEVLKKLQEISDSVGTT